jgi:hypothetical protein
MVGIALGQAERPLCAEKVADAAVGNPIASLVARATGNDMLFLCDQVEVCCGEIVSERDFTADKLEEHIDLLKWLKSLLVALGTDRSELPLPDEKQNLTLRAFSELPKKERGKQGKPTFSVVNTLGQVITQMERLHQRTWKEPSANWEPKIRSMLREKAAPRLWRMRKELLAVAEDASLASQMAESAWLGNTEILRSKKPCCGRQER